MNALYCTLHEPQDSCLKIGYVLFFWKKREHNQHKILRYFDIHEVLKYFGLRGHHDVPDLLFLLFSAQAVKKNHFHVVRILLEHGTNIGAASASDRHSLALARQLNYQPIVEILTAHKTQ